MIRKEINSAEMEFPFIIYHPEKTDESLPLIIQLHGAGEVGAGGEELVKVDGYGFPLIFREEEINCILVMPQCPADSFWVAQIQNIRLFTEQLVNEYNVDESRIYLTGLSMGGYGTWYTALAFPEIFAAIAPICGGGMPWRANVLDMPVWAFHGSEDEVVLPSETMNMIHALRKTAKQEVRFTMFDGVEHGSWVPAYNKELLGWLLKQKR